MVAFISDLLLLLLLPGKKHFFLSRREKRLLTFHVASLQLILRRIPLQTFFYLQTIAAFLSRVHI